MLGGIGTWEILLIFLVILLLFGAKRIPDIAKSVGKGVTEFKRGLRDIQDEIETGVDQPSKNDGKTSDTEKTAKP
jgi:sec-independent protein translocase protein TatA